MIPFLIPLSLSRGLREIHEGSENYGRLQRGFDAWISAITSPRYYKRIREFVRSIEAVVKPKIGDTRSQFVHRAQLFLGRSQESKAVLTNIYDIRSCAEHMNDIKTFYPGLPNEEISRKTALPAFQAELLANYIYRRIFEETEVRQIFINDSAIDSFWKETEGNQTLKWGKELNLENELTTFFYPFGNATERIGSVFLSENVSLI